MARDYYNLEPDKAYILPGGLHHTKGRGGANIQFITRHHLMMIGEGEAVVDQVWSSREASAHHVVGPRGRWVQTVWDNDTAWANANQWANQRTIAIEHSNITGRVAGGDYAPGSWNISNETLITGARIAAAYCLKFGLGRPEYGKNIRDHGEFTSTGCPVHLWGPNPRNPFGGRPGKYHQFWMDEAQRFYDQLKSNAVYPDGTPKQGVENNVNMPAWTRDVPGALNEAKLASIAARDIASDVQTQLRGPGNQGWSQLGKNDRGQNLTLVDAVAALRQDVAALHTKLDKISKGVK